MKKLAFSLATLIIFLLSCKDDNKIDIWNNEIPNYIKGSKTEVLSYPIKSKAKHPAIIICPGGGYSSHAKHESEPIAQFLNSFGVSAFILNYRLPNSENSDNQSMVALQDIQQCIRYIRKNADKWNIDKHKIGVMGFSAGGHVAASACAHHDTLTYKTNDTTSARPDFAALIYPVISMDSTLTHTDSKNRLLGENPTQSMINFFSLEKQVNGQTPPTYLVHSANDSVVSVGNSALYLKELKNYSIKYEVRPYKVGGHGYSLATHLNNGVNQWPGKFIEWLYRMNYLVMHKAE